ncbi:NADPH-dependent FMN reductase [Croceivirga thetidis]|uniref:NAD(P)H-dependent oxidoreductase n=1 Tax=Croceivirga thetidis TaxID=2721623 RepID=A0ABX1GS70_9FLAO|nr:NAD(P)H-dependent oxidoreductase [Croceivirga thetidis]NKI32478.1 NAD(P)H-dependent oxidoreductase [Croceivirga thetidis]
MAQLLAFAGSNSSTSINYKLVKYTVKLVEGHQIQTLNLANYPFPMFSEDTEKKEGYSNSLVEFKNDIQKVDGLIISVNEHNGNPSAYFKNVLDWLSRLERKFLLDKKVLLMSTAPGKRGGIGALGVIESLLPRFGAEICATFSLPFFHENFDADLGITDSELSDAHKEALQRFLNSL